MPVQYAAGVLKEHLHTRNAAGLFDVSHMGQVTIRPKSGAIADAALALEALVPVDILGLAPGRQRYGLLTDARGGIVDDLMITNRGDHLFLVVNAGCKDSDLAHLRVYLSDSCDVAMLADRALIALQGPKAETALAALNPDVSAMRFMDVADITLLGVACIVSRSGYSGEDGFEISVPADAAEALCKALLAHPDVAPVGLGARDSLRLEAGLCLYGQDIDTTTTPVEAGLEWAIQKVRRSGGARAGGFPGASVILDQMQNGASRRRVGLKPDGKAPGSRRWRHCLQMKEARHRLVLCLPAALAPLSRPLSPWAMLPQCWLRQAPRYLPEVRGKYLPVTVCALPFITPAYKR